MDLDGDGGKRRGRIKQPGQSLDRRRRTTTAWKAMAIGAEANR